MSPKPKFADEWPALAQVANHILAARVAGFPAAVEAGKMTPEAAARGIRISTALATLWQAVTRRTDIPPLDAKWSEMADDLATAAARAAGKQMPAGEDYPACVAALAWHAQPWMPGAPTARIAAIHLINQSARAMQAVAQKMKEAA